MNETDTSKVIAMEFEEFFTSGETGSSTFAQLDKEFDYLFIQSVLASAYELLAVRGYLFLNQLREMLGFDYIPVGQIVGWLNVKDFSTLPALQFTWDEEKKAYHLIFRTRGDIHNKI